MEEQSYKPNTKNWKNYFLEFFMLFLAVTLGFLADNYRESLSENVIEKEYIKSLIEDLKNDQQLIEQHISHIKTSELMLDSLVDILNSPKTINQHAGQLYYLSRLGPRLKPFATSNKTYDQLKNSGNFRLIKKFNVSNKIVAYYDKFPQLRLLERINDDEFSDFKRIASKIFDPAVFIRMKGPNNLVKRLNDNPPLRNADNELLQELSIFSIYLSSTKGGLLSVDYELKAMGDELIQTLQKEYNLE